jgi:hypothetical protein
MFFQNHDPVAGSRSALLAKMALKTRHHLAIRIEETSSRSHLPSTRNDLQTLPNRSRI